MNQHPTYKDPLSSLSFKMRKFIMDLIGGWRGREDDGDDFENVARKTDEKKIRSKGFGWLLMNFAE